MYGAFTPYKIIKKIYSYTLHRLELSINDPKNYQTNSLVIIKLYVKFIYTNRLLNVDSNPEALEYLLNRLILSRVLNKDNFEFDLFHLYYTDHTICNQIQSRPVSETEI